MRATSSRARFRALGVGLGVGTVEVLLAERHHLLPVRPVLRGNERRDGVEGEPLAVEEAGSSRSLVTQSVAAASP